MEKGAKERCIDLGESVFSDYWRKLFHLAIQQNRILTWEECLEWEYIESGYGNLYFKFNLEKFPLVQVCIYENLIDNPIYPVTYPKVHVNEIHDALGG